MLEITCTPPALAGAWEPGPSGGRVLRLVGVDPQAGVTVALLISEDTWSKVLERVGTSAGVALAGLEDIQQILQQRLNRDGEG